MKKLFMTGAIIALGIFPFSAFAAMDTVKFQESLNALNRLKPLQNPQYQKSSAILHGNVIDQQNKVIGQIDDVLVLSDGGAVMSLQVTFDRLQLREPVFLDFQKMKIGAASNGYQLSLRGEEVASIYPELLSNIETAAGTDNEIVSVNGLIGKSVSGANGQAIGEIQDVLFRKKGEQVDSVYVNVNSGIIRNVGVAIPISALNFSEYHERMSVKMAQDQADLLVEFANQRR